MQYSCIPDKNFCCYNLYLKFSCIPRPALRLDTKILSLVSGLVICHVHISAMACEIGFTDDDITKNDKIVSLCQCKVSVSAILSAIRLIQKLLTAKPSLSC